MPTLSIIPARAVADADISDTQLRVLCAIGTFSNRLGGNVWASVQTMAKGCNLSPRTVQRALPQLVKLGYLRSVERPGRTTVYEIALESPLTGESPGGDTGVTPPPTQLCHPNDKKNDKKNDKAQEKEKDKAVRQLTQDVTRRIWGVFPARDTPHLFPPALRAIGECLRAGASPERLIDAAAIYAQECLKKQTDPRYVRTVSRFYSDGAWEHYVAEVRVHGRTREEWARSGQDVLEFDRLAEEAA